MNFPSTQELGLLHTTICQALSDPKRIQIFYALHEQPRNVSSLAEALGFPQPTVSRHLRILRQRALVLTERDGPSVIYRLADDRVIQVLETMRGVMRDALNRQTELISEDFMAEAG